MKAAVITPYCKEELSILSRCHRSVGNQEVGCRHFMVADGFAREEVSGWDCEHIILSKPHADTGNTPRAIGALSAMNQGYELICFLDADNWYGPDHIAEAIRMKRENPDADIAALRRHIVLPDGTPVPDSSEDIDRRHIDTSCYAFFESGFPLLSLWAMMPPFLGPMGDRIIFAAAQARGMRVVWSTRKTCTYVSNYRESYLAANRIPPAQTNDADFTSISEQIRAHRSLVQARIGMTIDVRMSH